MNRQTLPTLILVSVTCLVRLPPDCAISAQVRFRQTPSTAKTRTHPPPSLKKYFPPRVGKFTLETANLSDAETESMKRSWVSLFGATDFARAIYLIPDPEVQEISQALERAVLFTVASFPSGERAEAAVASLTGVLTGRGYTIERRRSAESGGRAAKEMALATSQNADDWAVIWSRGAVVFRVQVARKKEAALDFAHSFPY